MLYFKILYDLTPIHLELTEIVIMLIKCISNNTITINWIYSTLIVILEFVLYLKIIVFNFCDLNENIENKINERGIDGMINDVKNLKNYKKKNVYSENLENEED